jgi:uncharacterized protein YjaG (DUF416 family)
MEDDFQNFLDGLGERLAELSTYSQCAFATACCERHFRDYEEFVKVDGWGDIVSLREIVDFGWRALSTDVSVPTDLVERCQKAIPDSEDFSSPASGAALCVGVMVAYLADFLTSRNTQDVVWIASNARDLVDQKVVLALEDGILITPSIERKINSSEPMRDELKAQREILELASFPSVQGFRAELERMKILVPLNHS